MKKGFKRIWIKIFLCTLLFIAVSAVTQKRVSATENYTIQEGESLTLYLNTSRILHGSGWISNDIDTVQITSQGLNSCTIKGIKATGRTAIIFCDYYYLAPSGIYTYMGHGFEDFNVTVKAPDPKKVSIVSQTSLRVGQTATLTPTIYPSNAASDYTWNSSDTQVASVSNGVITANHVGTAVITVMTQNGCTSACLVNVSERLITFGWSTPARDSSNVACDITLKAVFEFNLYKGRNFSNIKLINKSDGSNVPGTSSIVDNIVTFKPNIELKNGVTYEYNIPYGALTDNGGMNNETTSISFTTVPSSVKKTIPKLGTIFKVSGASFIITKASASNGKVFYEKAASKSITEATIPSKVKYKGYTYTVTGISSMAFYKCSKLKKLIINSSDIQTVEKNAMKGVNKKLKISCPAKKLKSYKKLLNSKTGFVSSMKIK